MDSLKVIKQRLKLPEQYPPNWRAAEDDKDYGEYPPRVLNTGRFQPKWWWRDPMMEDTSRDIGAGVRRTML
jgi:hypothetical protein